MLATSVPSFYGHTSRKQPVPVFVPKLFAEKQLPLFYLQRVHLLR